METPQLIMLVIAVAVLLFGLIVFAAVVVTKFYRKVPQGTALIINKRKEIVVNFRGGLVWPIVDKAEIMDISVKAIDVDRKGQDGLICQDNIRADIKVTFYVRVNATQEDVKMVAASVGCERASSRDTLEELFLAKFSEALKTVGKQMDFTELFTEREKFKEEILKVIGEYLNGYKLEDVAIDYLEQTPKASLDPDNILDAEGIRKITDLTAAQAIETNRFERNKEATIRQEDVETREKILELDRQQADAEARQQREIESLRAREWAEAERVKAEEQLKARSAAIKTEEELAVAEENKARQVAVAEKNRERTIAVEEERVVRDRDLEATERQRLVDIKVIEKDKAIEVEKKKIADVIRDRVIVEKTVAEEEEKIKDTRAFAGAERERKVEVIEAEREAEKQKVALVKDAQAREEAAKSLREESVTMAEATLLAAEKEAEAKKVMAEGVIAENSASGLASVKVQEAEAGAIELRGKADAVVQVEAHKAEAFGTEATGEAEAKAARAKYSAEAEGTELTGTAKATAARANYSAEAEGINEKAEAMKNFDGVGREHEEFKLELEKEKQIDLARIDVDRQVAAYQAEILGESMKTANIDIVGGGDDFLKTFFKSISLAKSVDGFVEHSDVVGQLADDDTRAALAKRLRTLVSEAGIGSEDIKNLTISALLAKLALKGGAVGNEAASLQGTVKQLGMDDLAALWLAK
jgi:uncharacterized membrane protein YqiK